MERGSMSYSSSNKSGDAKVSFGVRQLLKTVDIVQTKGVLTPDKWSGEADFSLLARQWLWGRKELCVSSTHKRNLRHQHCELVHLALKLSKKTFPSPMQEDTTSLHLLADAERELVKHLLFNIESPVSHVLALNDTLGVYDPEPRDYPTCLRFLSVNAGVSIFSILLPLMWGWVCLRGIVSQQLSWTFVVATLTPMVLFAAWRSWLEVRMVSGDELTTHVEKGISATWEEVFSSSSPEDGILIALLLRYYQAVAKKSLVPVPFKSLTPSQAYFMLSTFHGLEELLSTEDLYKSFNDLWDKHRGVHEELAYREAIVDSSSNHSLSAPVDMFVLDTSMPVDRSDSVSIR